MPIGLSFILMRLLTITPLQAFAAGAALCSTSLGTTFTILSTSGLSDSRLGVILSSAAMLDDVVGLIMVQVISDLGSVDDGSSLSAVTVIRPVFVSLAFAVIVPIICKITAFVARKLIPRPGSEENNSTMRRLCLDRRTAFCVQTLVLIAFVVASTYAGTSNLFAAYLAGASISWWSSLDLGSSRNSVTRSTQAKSERETDAAEQVRPPSTTSRNGSIDTAGHALSGEAIYNEYYSAVVNRILKPLFFASIGFSIPITQLFTGAIVWRGIVYTILMIIGKLVCGFWLVRFSGVPSLPLPALFKKDQAEKCAGIQSPTSKNKKRKRHAVQTALDSASTHTDAAPRSAAVQTQANTSKKLTPSKIPKPKSLYPPLMLGSAMVARGEIGFLISSLAESTGIFSSGADGSSELFLVVTWAVLLCTIIGPLSIGVMVKRVRRLQRRERQGGTRAGKEDPLGIWSVVSST